MFHLGTLASGKHGRQSNVRFPPIADAQLSGQNQPIRTLVLFCLMLTACARLGAGTKDFSGQISVGTETTFVSDEVLMAGAKDEKAQGKPALLQVSYLDGSERAFEPLLAAVAHGKSKGLPFAGMNLRARFRGRMMGDRDDALNPAIEVFEFKEVRICPRLPQSLHGCSN